MNYRQSESENLANGVKKERKNKSSFKRMISIKRRLSERKTTKNGSMEEKKIKKTRRIREPEKQD